MQTQLEKHIINLIEENGAMRLDTFMGIALSHPEHGYYMKQDPFGQAGDFTTAPEISQLFGEMVAVFIIHAWEQMGKPLPFHLYEMGPGRGTLIDDVLRTLKTIQPSLYQALSVTLIETSLALSAKQQEKLDAYNQDLDLNWQEELPKKMTGAFFILGNELLDALPIRQFEKQDDQWFERYINYTSENKVLEIVLKPSDDAQSIIPEAFQDNVFYEYNAPAENIISQIANYRKKQSGAALFIDYGYAQQSGLKDTIQALKDHEYQAILDNIGDQDLTAHVNFMRLIEIAQDQGLGAQLTTQAQFLNALGLEQRAKQLALQNPAKAKEIELSVARLCDEDQMGDLFKVLMLG